MKKLYALSMLFLLGLTALAQDIIVKTNGEEINAKVEEITLDAIFYRLPESMESAPSAIHKREVFMVKFANGTKELINAQTTVTATPQTAPSTATDGRLSRQQMNLLGQQEARMFYTGNKPMWGSAAAVFLLGPYGLPISAVVAAVKPNIKIGEVSQVQYLNDPDFLMGYKRQAHRKKVGKTALGAGIGFGTLLVLVAILSPPQ